MRLASPQCTAIAAYRFKDRTKKIAWLSLVSSNWTNSALRSKASLLQRDGMEGSFIVHRIFFSLSHIPSSPTAQYMGFKNSEAMMPRNHSLLQPHWTRIRNAWNGSQLNS